MARTTLPASERVLFLRTGTNRITEDWRSIPPQVLDRLALADELERIADALRWSPDALRWSPDAAVAGFTLDCRYTDRHGTSPTRISIQPAFNRLTAEREDDGTHD